MVYLLHLISFNLCFYFILLFLVYLMHFISFNLCFYFILLFFLFICFSIIFIGLYLVSCPMQLRSEQIWTSLYTALVYTVLLLCFIIYSCPLDTEGEGSPDFSMITSCSFVNTVSLSRNLTSCCACPPQAMPLNNSMFFCP